MQSSPAPTFDFTKVRFAGKTRRLPETGYSIHTVKISHGHDQESTFFVMNPRLYKVLNSPKFVRYELEETLRYLAIIPSEGEDDSIMYGQIVRVWTPPYAHVCGHGARLPNGDLLSDHAYLPADKFYQAVHVGGAAVIDLSSPISDEYSMPLSVVMETIRNMGVPLDKLLDFLGISLEQYVARYMAQGYANYPLGYQEFAKKEARGYLEDISLDTGFVLPSQEPEKEITHA